MNTPPPREPVICPIHRDVLDPPMTYIQTWDARDWYECPVPHCSCAIDYPAHDTPRPAAHQHPRQDDPTFSTDPEI